MRQCDGMFLPLPLNWSIYSCVSDSNGEFLPHTFKCCQWGVKRPYCWRGWKPVHAHWNAPAYWIHLQMCKDRGDHVSSKATQLTCAAAFCLLCFLPKSKDFHLVLFLGFLFELSGRHRNSESDATFAREVHQTSQRTSPTEASESVKIPVILILCLLDNQRECLNKSLFVTFGPCLQNIVTKTDTTVLPPTFGLGIKKFLCVQFLDDPSLSVTSCLVSEGEKYFRKGLR